MNIQRLQIKGLYGYIEKDISFEKKFNILVGINGSSKTSVLNIISWLLQPSIPHLCTIDFQFIKLDFTFENKQCSIHCEQVGHEFRYHLNHPDHKKLHPLIVQLAADPSTLRTSVQQADLRKIVYNGLAPDKKEIKTWSLIQSLPSPIVVGLERTLAGDGPSFHVSEAKAISLGMTPDRDGARDSPSPILRVQQMARDSFSRHRALMISLNDTFRDQIMLSAFDSAMLPGSPNKRPKSKVQPLTAHQIDALESRITTFFTQENQLRPNETGKKTTDIGAVAQQYLQNLKMAVADQETNSVVNVYTQQMLHAHFARVNKLLLYAEKFDTQSKQSALEIDRYLEVLNKFFKDSSKKIFFEPETGNLQFCLLDKNGNKVADNRPIEVLSSGEKQILVLLTYLAFIPGKIFIIDEPELSLHPKWQEEFMEAVMSLMPDSTQLVIATHSPSLVGRNIQFCKTLFPYNSK